ncbi:MAG: hypothetical protein GWO23_18290, partial [Gammaproteobacteria bacterium]|nr:hypothetical protein [Gammaproteobacteria bacterium]NIR25964.1 hypothetical protein [Gammaproteobacteria bacterium]
KQDDIRSAIQPSDATLLQRILDQTQPNPFQQIAADVNNRPGIDEDDLTKLNNYLRNPEGEDIGAVGQLRFCAIDADGNIL